MFKPEPRFFSSPGIIGIYAAGAKILVGILNAPCWMVHYAASSCVACFCSARSFAEEAPFHGEIGTPEYTGIMLSHIWVTGQGYCFILLLRGPIRKLCEPCSALRHYRTGGLWAWCQADQLHQAHRITEEEKGTLVQAWNRGSPLQWWVLTPNLYFEDIVGSSGAAEK